jgi:hypothetical protein
MPVKAPAYQKGQDARAQLALTKSALDLANDRLSAFSGWYEMLRHDYGAGK